MVTYSTTVLSLIVNMNEIVEIEIVQIVVGGKMLFKISI